MPYLDVRIATEASPTVAENVISILMTHTAEILSKKPEVTSIAIQFVAPVMWFVGGTRVSEQDAVTFYLDIKITEGTNTKAEKAAYIDKVFADMQSSWDRSQRRATSLFTMYGVIRGDSRVKRKSIGLLERSRYEDKEE